MWIRKFFLRLNWTQKPDGSVFVPTLLKTQAESTMVKLVKFSKYWISQFFWWDKIYLLHLWFAFYIHRQLNKEFPNLHELNFHILSLWILRACRIYRSQIQNWYNYQLIYIVQDTPQNQWIGCPICHQLIFCQPLQTVKYSLVLWWNLFLYIQHICYFREHLQLNKDILRNARRWNQTSHEAMNPSNQKSLFWFFSNSHK